MPYIERMDLAHAAADAVLCRAGATTVAEVSRGGVQVRVGEDVVVEADRRADRRAVPRPRLPAGFLHTRSGVPARPATLKMWL